MSAAIAVQLIDALRAQGVTVVAVGDVLRVTAPRGAVTDHVRKQLREHKSALLRVLQEKPATDAPRPPDVHSAPLNVRCFACHNGRFWVATAGHTVCATCHPPADPSFVARWITPDETANA